MIVTGPQTIPVGSATTVGDPAQAGGNPSAAVQIQNSSPYQLNVLAAGDVLSIQPFFAQTVEISGQPITVTPLASLTLSAPCVVTFVFLLTTAANTGVQLPDGVWVETPPQEDGPLTAAAIASALSVQGTIDQLATGGPTSLVGGSVNLIGGTGTPALHSYATLYLSIAFTAAAPAALFAQGSRFPSGGGPALEFPLISIYPNGPGSRSSVLPFACQSGDGVDVQVTPNAAGNITWTLFGGTEEIQVQNLRTDGRAYPIGLFSTGSTTPSTTLIGAPAFAGVRILIKSFALSCLTSSVSLQATMQGSLRTISILNAAGTVDAREFESGLLCDANTAVNFAGAGTGSASMLYDLVI